MSCLNFVEEGCGIELLSTSSFKCPHFCVAALLRIVNGTRHKELGRQAPPAQGRGGKKSAVVMLRWWGITISIPELSYSRHPMSKLLLKIGTNMLRRTVPEFRVKIFKGHKITHRIFLVLLFYQKSGSDSSF